MLPAQFQAYCREFQVADNQVLRAFTHMFARPRRNLEYSVKLGEGAPSAARFALIFDQDLGVCIRDIQATLAKIEDSADVHIDRSLLGLLLDELDLGHVTLAALGIDVREKAADSRLKVWLSLVEDPLRINRLLDAAQVDDEFLALFPGNVLLAGVDLSLSGKTRLKLYPKYTQAELMNRAIRARLSRVLAPETLGWMSRCKRANISLEENRARVIHLQPLEPAAMLADLPGAEVAAIAQRFDRLGLRLNVISAPEAELIAGAPRHLNLYYVGAET